MITVDANILIYAYHRRSPFHGAAKEWLERTFNGRETVKLPWTVIHAFLRLTTNSNAGAHPFTAAEATTIVDLWLDKAGVGILEAGPRYRAIFTELVRSLGVTGNLVSDAHLAALAIEHDATLYTNDRDFARFKGVRVVNPLA